MVVSTVTPPAAQPPPDLPPLPGAPPALPDYLRRFSLWCRNGFADKVSATTAQPDLMLLSIGGFVYKIKINDDGSLTATPIVLRSGAEGTPVLWFAPVGATIPDVTLLSAGGFIYRIEVDDAGHLTSTPIDPITGAELTPVMTFAPICMNVGTNGSPAGTASASYRMMGFGSALGLTITVGTKAEIIVDGQMNNSVAGGLSQAIICYGTGTPPNNGAVQTGTTIAPVALFIAEAANDFGSFSMLRRTPNLTVNTPYWFDLAVLSTGGGVAAVQNVHMVAHEIP